MVIEFARTGDLTLKALLLRVCAEYPQAIYYHLRDPGLRRKRQQLKDAQGNAVDPCDELRRAIGQHHPVLYEMLNRLTQGLREGLSPHPYEDFVAVMESVIVDIFRKIHLRIDQPISNHILETIAKTCYVPNMADTRSDQDRSIDRKSTRLNSSH